MRLIKHNAIDNFSCFPQEEKEDLLIQEMSKMFLLYPRATADILDTCGIKYKSLKPQDLSLAIEKNGKNLKMLNRVIRLSFVVNGTGNTSMKGHNRMISYRDVMKKGKPLIVDNKDAMKEATLMTRDLMAEERFSKLLGRNVKTYLNLDGQQDEAPKEVVEEEKKGIPTWLWVSMAIVLVGVGVYFYKKSQNTETTL
jgi:hypothetical protein